MANETEQNAPGLFEGAGNPTPPEPCRAVCYAGSFRREPEKEQQP